MADGSIAQGLRAILGKEIFGPVTDDAMPVDQDADLGDNDGQTEAKVVEEAATPIMATESADSAGDPIQEEGATDEAIEGEADDPQVLEGKEGEATELPTAAQEAVVEEGEEVEDGLMMEDGEEAS